MLLVVVVGSKWQYLVVGCVSANLFFFSFKIVFFFSICAVDDIDIQGNSWFQTYDFLFFIFQFVVGLLLYLLLIFLYLYIYRKYWYGITINVGILLILFKKFSYAFSKLEIWNPTKKSYYKVGKTWCQIISQIWLDSNKLESYLELMQVEIGVGFGFKFQKR